MVWDGAAISSAATTVTETVQGSPMLRYLAVFGGMLWLVERFRPQRRRSPSPPIPSPPQQQPLDRSPPLLRPRRSE
jgi:hypothetical protein